MKLIDFLRHKTNALELCAIRDSGYIVATCWTDYEDLFQIPSKLSQQTVKRDEWDYLTIVNENNAKIKIPCHYVDI